MPDMADMINDLSTDTVLGRIELEPEDVVNMDVALDAAFAKLGLDTMGGASGYGWSRYRDLQMCPHKFWRKHVDPKRHKRDEVRHPSALQLGSAFHAFLAIYYQRQIDLLAKKPPVPEAGELCDLVLANGGEPVLVNEAWRLFEAYANYYETHNDYLTPLAVELLAKDKGGPSTCRYDLVARVESTDGKILPGTYIVEHKTSSRMDRSVTEGWHLDGEIIGEVMLWNKSGMKRKYGPLQGVIVNIITKTKVVNFHREIVSPPTGQLRKQYNDLKVWRAMEQVYTATNKWPRAMAACWGRYGACEFFEECRDSK